MSNPVHTNLEHTINASGSKRAAPRLADMLAPEANNFGLVRVAMALAVLVSHGFFLYTGTTAAEPLVGWTGHSLGEHAVQVFFFLSGILVAQSFDRSRSLLDFALARVLRIFPGLLICVFVTVAFIGPAVTNLPIFAYFTHSETLAYVIKTVSLSTGSATLPGVFETAPAPGLVNMSLWTLKYEVLCYGGLAALGCVGLFKPEWRKYAAAALALGVAVIFIEQPKTADAYTAADNIRYFSVFFFAGTLAYLMRSALVIHGGVCVALFVLFVGAIGTRFGVLATAAFLGYATLYVASLPAGRMRMLANRYDVSFGVYIYACPIQQVLIGGFPEAGPAALIVFATALTLPVAMISWLVVERPSLEARKPLAAMLSGWLSSLGNMRVPFAGRIEASR
ncbi:MAG: acyltransferase [Hyphomicrobiaceae bacterium]|nr:acyltransferase [Hyphomicrobiaceae bacterium]